MYTNKQHTGNDPFQNATSEDIGGYSVYIRQTTRMKHSKTIVLVHGIGVSSNYYLPLARELSEQFNVIAIDLPGYGKTSKPATALTIKQLAAVVAALLVSRNLQDVTLIGHSMGCQIVAHTRGMARDRVEKLILMSPTVNRKERTVFKQAVRLAQDTLHETPKTNAIIFSDYLRMGVRRYIKTSGYMVTDLLEETVHDNTTQTLILRGEKDYIVPRDWTTHLESISSSHSLVELPGAPHAFHYAYAKQTAKLCAEFIKK